MTTQAHQSGFKYINIECFLSTTVPGTDVNLHISRTSLEEHSMTVITCNTSSNLSPTLELCRLKVSQTVEVLHSVNETVLTYMMMVEAADNGAEFYCKETNAGLESRKQTINVWCKYRVHKI